MPWVAPVVAAGAAVGSSALAAQAKASSDEQAAKERANALQMWLDTNIPDIESQKIYLERLKSQGQLDPETEQAYLQQQSEMASITTDPRLKEAQLGALSKLQQIGDEGGMLLEDKANLNKITADNAAAEQGQRGAILQNMQSRGMGGSGMEMAANLANQQGAATRAANQSMSVAGMAQQRALDSIMKGGQLGGEMRGQEFGEAARKAEAQDAINRFNTQNRSDVQQRNVASRNDAQRYNLGESQRIADANVGLGNQQDVHNKGLAQQRYNNELSRTAGATGQYNTNANATAAKGQADAAMIGAVGQTIGKVGTAYANQDDDEDETTNMFKAKKRTDYNGGGGNLV